MSQRELAERAGVLITMISAYERDLRQRTLTTLLNRHQVRYVIIGAFAAIAQQAPIPATRDIDVEHRAWPGQPG
jgi:transcriptional regulator with XRE-family HTH domain